MKSSLSSLLLVFILLAPCGVVAKWLKYKGNSG
jgi:hypothetical protein